MFNTNKDNLDYEIASLIATKLSIPFNEWEAYKLGIIDESGNILRPPKSPEDKKAFTYVDEVCLKVKKLIPSHLWYLLKNNYLIRK